MNYHTISDYRSSGGEVLTAVLTELLAALLKSGVVRTKRLAVDGLRVRASAGADSFHREPTLEKCAAEAKRLLTKAAKNATDPHRSKRKAAAQERAARERQERAQQALDELPSARAAKETQEDKAKARVSTTDPEARVMRMPDNGLRPAFNVQLATDTESRLIVGVRVTNVGADSGQLRPMLDEVESRVGTRPPEVLADGGFVNRKAFEACANEGITVYAPLPTRRK